MQIRSLLVLIFWSFTAIAADTEQMMRDGIAFHDQGKYEESAELFRKVLEIEPGNALAGYELAFTYQASGQLDRCIDAAASSLGAPAEDEAEPYLISGLYMILASCHSASGDTETALEIFALALEQFPNSYDLHFNVAISHSKRGEYDDAIQHLYRALEIDPNRASPYFMLGANYAEQSKDTLAILAYISFLQLEFNTDRCVTASRDIFDLVFARVGTESGAIIIVVDVSADDLFAGLSELDMVISIAAVANSDQDGVRDPVAESFAGALKMIIVAASNLDFEGDENSNIGRFLLPGSRRLNNNDATEAFAWFTVQTAGIPGASEWLNTHSAETDALVEYLNSLGDR